jgi:hypothetical protein
VEKSVIIGFESPFPFVFICEKFYQQSIGIPPIQTTLASTILSEILCLFESGASVEHYGGKQQNW